jgi:hypothetical protein
VRQLSRRLLGGLAFGALAVALATGAQGAENADASLAFFDTVEKVPPTHPERYERMVQSRGTELYVARVPALVIRTNEIMSVVVDRTGYEYRATISIAPDAAQRLHQSQYAPHRRAGSVGAHGAWRGAERGSNQQGFAPLGSKLSWKRDGR